MTSEEPTSTLHIEVVLNNDRRLAETVLLELRAFAGREGLQVSSAAVVRPAPRTD